MMRGGEIVEEGVTADVMDHPSHAYTKSLIEAVPQPRTIPAEPLSATAAAG